MKKLFILFMLASCAALVAGSHDSDSKMTDKKTVQPGQSLNETTGSPQDSSMDSDSMSGHSSTYGTDSDRYSGRSYSSGESNTYGTGDHSRYSGTESSYSSKYDSSYGSNSGPEGYGSPSTGRYGYDYGSGSNSPSGSGYGMGSH